MRGGLLDEPGRGADVTGPGIRRFDYRTINVVNSPLSALLLIGREASSGVLLS
jgi:hypothetical protein